MGFPRGPAPQAISGFGGSNGEAASRQIGSDGSLITPVGHGDLLSELWIALAADSPQSLTGLAKENWGGTGHSTWWGNKHLALLEPIEVRGMGGIFRTARKNGCPGHS